MNIADAPVTTGQPVATVDPCVRCGASPSGPTSPRPLAPLQELAMNLRWAWDERHPRPVPVGRPRRVGRHPPRPGRACWPPPPPNAWPSSRHDPAFLRFLRFGPRGPDPLPRRAPLVPEPHDQPAPARSPTSPPSSASPRPSPSTRAASASWPATTSSRPATSASRSSASASSTATATSARGCRPTAGSRSASPTRTPAPCR